MPDFIKTKFINLEIVCEHTVTTACLNSRKPERKKFYLIHSYEVTGYRLSLKLIYCKAFDYSLLWLPGSCLRLPNKRFWITTDLIQYDTSLRSWEHVTWSGMCNITAQDIFQLLHLYIWSITQSIVSKIYFTYCM